ncbi:unnamed protein product [Caenorhabditis angaria]|uniref:CHK kinase-like domain-containing protein n=1 Tax=Caenorhabditis angaria TaxID=860376 RepID=A0A9P1J2D7_9PELO|nr:unnamed protein product [Caenorhabditis angaria]
MPPKLHDISDGILETFVTWEDVENELRLSFKTESRFGEKKQATNIGDMKGFMSKIALIEPDWQPKSPNLPEKLAIKISSSLAFINLSKLLKFGGENGLSDEKIETFDEISLGIRKNAENPENLKFAGDLDLLPRILKDFGDRKSTYQSIRQNFPENLKCDVEKLIEIYQFLMKPEQIEKLSGICAYFGYPAQLVHGDLWPGNLLFSKESPLELGAIIDFQAVSFGSPAQDLTRLFISILSAESRRGQNLDSLLEFFYANVTENLEKSDPKIKIPYTLEQLQKSYRLFFPMMSSMILPGILRFSNDKLNSDLAREKSRGILEDVLEIHQSNLENFADFFE